MTEPRVNPNCRLEDQGITGFCRAYYNLVEPALVEAAIQRGEGRLGSGGAFWSRPAIIPGVRPRTSTSSARRWSKTPSGGKTTARCRLRPSTACMPTCLAHEGQGLLRAGSVRRRRPGAAAGCARGDRTGLAWPFIRHLLRRPAASELASFVPEFTIINRPSFKADPARHGCRSPER